MPAETFHFGHTSEIVEAHFVRFAYIAFGPGYVLDIRALLHPKVTTLYWRLPLDSSEANSISTVKSNLLSKQKLMILH